MLSLIISIVNIIVDFPAQLFDIAVKEEESLHFTLQAEHATKTWEDKLAVEVQENVKMMLKMSTQFENNSIPGMEAPGLVIEDEKKLGNDLRDGKRKKKPEEPEPEEDLRRT